MFSYHGLYNIFLFSLQERLGVASLNNMIFQGNKFGTEICPWREEWAMRVGRKYKNEWRSAMVNGGEYEVECNKWKLEYQENVRDINTLYLNDEMIVLL